jgi:hypothetical protein
MSTAIKLLLGVRAKSTLNLRRNAYAGGRKCVHSDTVLYPFSKGVESSIRICPIATETVVYTWCDKHAVKVMDVGILSRNSVIVV